MRRSALGERRPIDDEACIAGMLEHASLTITAWDGNELRLVSAPAAMGYYPKLGFVPNDRCWELPATAAEHGSAPVEGGTA